MNIKVVQDLICPWCYIGHHNLETALTQWTADNDAEVTIDWLPYQLDPLEPGAPQEDFRERFIKRKDMQPEQIDTMFDRVTQAGAALGITFNFDKVKVAVDTLPGHVAIAATPAAKQGALVNALHKAYFEEGKDIGATAEILAAADLVGLTPSDKEAISAALVDEAAVAKVQTNIRTVHAAGVNGVPYFVVDGKFGLSGGQPPEVFIQALEKASEPVPV